MSFKKTSLKTVLLATLVCAPACAEEYNIYQQFPGVLENMGRAGFEPVPGTGGLFFWAKENHRIYVTPTVFNGQLAGVQYYPYAEQFMIAHGPLGYQLIYSCLDAMKKPIEAEVAKAVEGFSVNQKLSMFGGLMGSVFTAQYFGFFGPNYVNLVIPSLHNAAKSAADTNGDDAGAASNVNPTETVDESAKPQASYWNRLPSLPSMNDVLSNLKSGWSSISGFVSSHPYALTSAAVIGVGAYGFYKWYNLQSKEDVLVDEQPVDTDTSVNADQ